ncbi:MAG: hypothetical protein EXS36_14890 [Pedosphaera sp.]|nr:hypothetical protein [Pedosphaera sp.]
MREPSIHWSGKKALFSMVIGAPAEQNLLAEFHGQIYEITGFFNTNIVRDALPGGAGPKRFLRLREHVE